MTRCSVFGQVSPCCFLPIHLPHFCLVFTKCKESVPNGARLENITWRLWHRELKGAVLEKASQITDECNAVEAIGLPEKSSYQPPTPSASSPCSSPSEGMLTPTWFHPRVIYFSMYHIALFHCPNRLSSSNYVIASRCPSFLLRSSLSSVLFPFTSTHPPCCIIVKECRPTVSEQADQWVITRCRADYLRFPAWLKHIHGPTFITN